MDTTGTLGVLTESIFGVWAKLSDNIGVVVLFVLISVGLVTAGVVGQAMAGNRIGAHSSRR